MPSSQAGYTTVTHFLLTSIKKTLRDFSSSKTLQLGYLPEPKRESTLVQLFRIDFKILLLIYKALNRQGPNYITKSLVSYVPLRTLWSSAAGLLEVPSSSWKKIGDAAFVNYAPKLWNTLSIDIREASSLDNFKRRLKTYLFTQACK